MGGISIAEVLRLRATSAVFGDKSVRRFAPTARRGRQDDGFVRRLKNRKTWLGVQKTRKTEKSQALRRANLHLRQSWGAAWSCRWPGRPPARRIRREELNGVEKDRSISPLGRARAAALVRGLVSGMQCSRLQFPLGWRLSPLFHEDAQILFFPAPISYLGERYVFPQRMAPGTICRGARFPAHKDTRYVSIGRYLGFCRYRYDSGWFRLGVMQIIF
jgi:hypothetical protein